MELCGLDILCVFWDYAAKKPPKNGGFFAVIFEAGNYAKAVFSPR